MISGTIMRETSRTPMWKTTRTLMSLISITLMRVATNPLMLVASTSSHGTVRRVALAGHICSGNICPTLKKKIISDCYFTKIQRNCFIWTTSLTIFVFDQNLWWLAFAWTWGIETVINCEEWMGNSLPKRIYDKMPLSGWFLGGTLSGYYKHNSNIIIVLAQAGKLWPG